MQAFSLDPDSGIPIKLQLKAHIRYQIIAGLLRPGDQLPPLRDLAAGLSVNLNTVVRAVHDLESEGYVYSHQGRGVFVSDEFPGQGHGAALRSLLTGILLPARDWGISPTEMALSMMAHAQLARPPVAAPHRLLLVGGSRLQLRRLQGELEAALPVVVEPALAEEVPDKVRTSHYRVAAATLFHSADARQAMPGAAVITLAPQAAQTAFATLSSLPEGTTVVIASRDWVHGARVRRSLEMAGLGRLKLEVAVGQTPAALSPGLDSASFVLVTPDCRELAREALAGRQLSIPLLPEPVEVPVEAVDTIRKALGVPVAEPKVHVRSAWV